MLSSTPSEIKTRERDPKTNITLCRFMTSIKSDSIFKSKSRPVNKRVSVYSLIGINSDLHIDLVNTESMLFLIKPALYGALSKINNHLDFLASCFDVGLLT